MVCPLTPNVPASISVSPDVSDVRRREPAVYVLSVLNETTAAVLFEFSDIQTPE